MDDMISRQAAIETVRKAKSIGQAHRMLVQLPSAQPDVPDTNVGDMISRQAAIDALDVLCQEHRYKIPGKRETYSQYNEAWQDALDRAEGAIFNLPSAQLERKKGEWIEREVTYIDDLEAKDIISAWQSCKCSVCGRYETKPYMYYFNAPKYCSWCGAEMEVSE